MSVGKTLSVSQCQFEPSRTGEKPDEPPYKNLGLNRRGGGYLAGVELEQ